MEMGKLSAECVPRLLPGIPGSVYEAGGGFEIALHPLVAVLCWISADRARMASIPLIGRIDTGF